MIYYTLRIGITSDKTRGLGKTFNSFNEARDYAMMAHITQHIGYAIIVRHDTSNLHSDAVIIAIKPVGEINFINILGVNNGY